MLKGEAAQLLSVESYRSKNSSKVSPVVTSSYLHRLTSKGSQCERRGDTQWCWECVSAGLGSGAGDSGTQAGCVESRLGQPQSYLYLILKFIQEFSQHSSVLVSAELLHLSTWRTSVLIGVSSSVNAVPCDCAQDRVLRIPDRWLRRDLQDLTLGLGEINREQWELNNLPS